MSAVVPMSKSRLIEEMKAGRASFELLLASLTAEAYLRIPVTGEWSVKDILAHIETWDRRFLGWIEVDERGEELPDPKPGLIWDDLDGINQQSFEQNKQRSLADVRAGYAESYRLLLAKAESLPEENLLDPKRYAWTNGDPLWQYFAANSYGHYGEHIEQIRRTAELV